MVIRSKGGNIALASLGVVYALTALVVLVWFVVDVWSAAAMIDRALQICLVAAIACGLWFVAIALQNLGAERGWLGRRRHV
jgi:fumarate reductase subunit D